MKCLIWDFDGTLGYRFGGMWTVTIVEMLQEDMPGRVVELDTIRPHLQGGFPWHNPQRPHPELSSPRSWWESMAPVLHRAFEAGGATPARARELAELFPARYLDLARWRLFEDAMPALTRLADDGWTHALLSNHVPELPRILEHLGLSGILAGVFNSAATGYEKPHAQAFRGVQRAFPHAEKFWMIGDSFPADVQGAQAVGIPAILVRKPHPEAKLYADDLSRVAAILAEGA